MISEYQEEIKKYLKSVNYATFEYSINISLKYKYIYVETPKVGCSTIKDTLQRMELDFPDMVRDDIYEIHERKYSPLLTPSQTCGLDRLLKDEGFFVFCFVRNPYARLLSSYLDKIVRGMPSKGCILNALGKDPSDLSAEVSFGEFVDVVRGQSVSQMDPHWRPQYDQTFQEWIEYDYVVRMERFQSDSEYVFNKVRKDYRQYSRSELSHATNARGRLSEYYTEEIRDKVYDRYRIDFEYFGYERTI